MLSSTYVSIFEEGFREGYREGFLKGFCEKLERAIRKLEHGKRARGNRAVVDAAAVEALGDGRLARLCAELCETTVDAAWQRALRDLERRAELDP